LFLVECLDETSSDNLVEVHIKQNDNGSIEILGINSTKIDKIFSICSNARSVHDPSFSSMAYGRDTMENSIKYNQHLLQETNHNDELAENPML
jgi:hypothetical protein